MKFKIILKLEKDGFLLIDETLRYIKAQKFCRFIIDPESVTNIIIVCPFNERLKKEVINNWNILSNVELSNLIQDELLTLNFESFAASVAFIHIKMNDIKYKIIGSHIKIYVNNVLLKCNDNLYFGAKDISGSNLYMISKIYYFQHNRKSLFSKKKSRNLVHFTNNKKVLVFKCKRRLRNDRCNKKCFIKKVKC